QVGQVLALVRSKARYVDETDHVVGRAGGGDDRPAVGVTDEQDRSVDLVDHPLEGVAVAAGQSAQRIRRRDHRHVFAEQLVVQTAKAGCVSERAVDENNGGISHSNSSSDQMKSPRASADAGTKSLATYCACSSLHRLTRHAITIR